MTDTPSTLPEAPRRAWLGRIVGLAILVVAVALAVYVVYYLDHSPRTSDAFVSAYTIGVASQVNGRIVRLRVQDNQAVKQGDVLFEIDPEPYQYALERARAALDSLEKQIGLTQRDVRSQQFAATAAVARSASPRATCNAASAERFALRASSTCSAVTYSFASSGSVRASVSAACFAATCARSMFAFAAPAANCCEFTSR